jgi:hypothetical protein
MAVWNCEPTTAALTSEQALQMRRFFLREQCAATAPDRAATNLAAKLSRAF